MLCVNALITMMDIEERSGFYDFPLAKNNLSSFVLLGGILVKHLMCALINKNYALFTKQATQCVSQSRHTTVQKFVPI